jgi:hypothetical protein
MREEFQADLNEVSRLLVTMAEAVRAAMRKATTALLTADLKAAETVIERDAEVDAIYRQVEAKVADTIARQAPVASDLRAALVGDAAAASLAASGSRYSPPACDRAQVVVEVVAQRDAGRDVEAGDVLVGDAVEVLDQRAQRVAVRGDQHGLAGAQVRHDRVVPVRQHPLDDVLEALGAGQQLVGRSRSAGRRLENSSSSSIGGGGVSYERRQSMNCSSPYSSRVCFLSLPCSAP